MSDMLAINDLKTPEAWRAALAEFFAMLLFVFIGTTTVVTTAMVAGGDPTPQRVVAIALAFGLSIAILVSATAKISGGHINPAVTIAAVATRKMGAAKGALYIVAQLVGAVVASVLLMVVVPDAAEGNLGTTGLGAGMTAGTGLIAEAIFTFLLVGVIFATAVDPKGPGHLAPFAIGVAVVVDHLAGIPLTGASMNPARSFGPALVSGTWANQWVYWVGPIVGGLLAAVIYQMVYLRKQAS